MYPAFIILTLALVPLIHAKPLRVGYVVHEKRASHLVDWQRTRLAPNTPLPLRIGLKQQNLEHLPDLLLAVSDPASPSYGQHWTHDQILHNFAPPEEAAKSVRRWLEASGVTPARIRLSADRAWVEVAGATSEEVERLLDARYHVYKREDGEEHVACDSYTLPQSISDIVDFVTPTVQPHAQASVITPTSRNIDSQRNLKKRTVEDTSDLSECEEVITPKCLKALYNMTYTPQSTTNNTLGIVNYYANIYLQSDLDTFFRNFSPSLVGKSPELVSIDGGSLEPDENTDVGEAGWILQYAMSLVQPQPVKLLQIGNKQIGEFRSFNEWLDAVDASYCTSSGGDDLTYDPTLPNPIPGQFNEHDCGTVKSPLVLSNSQATHEYAFSQFYLQRQCAEFAKLGLMGVTVLYSAGNIGTSGTQSGYCLDKNGSMNPNATLFNPSWPASCPWVTAVGGTQVVANASVTEEVWNQEVAPGFFESGGGGFSNRFPTPGYQKRAVDAYVTKLQRSDPKHLKLFNAKGRAYPDLSAIASGYISVENGSNTVNMGTSGAVPTVASIIALVNDARLTAGKKPVGFINPAIYSAAFSGSFNDITSGTNQGCRGLQGEGGGGFKADKGWDPASGLGTPNLGLLIEKWLALP